MRSILKGLKKRNKILIVILVGLFLFGIYILYINLIDQKSKLDTQALEKRIISLGELSTIEYYYQNILKYVDTKELKGIKLPFTTKSLFILYEGYVKAGVDLRDITIEIHSEDHIALHLKSADFTNNVINEESVKVYDERSGLFNPLKVEEVFQFLDREKIKLQQNLKEEGFLEEANQRAKKLITPLLIEMGFEKIDIKFY